MGGRARGAVSRVSGAGEAGISPSSMIARRSRLLEQAAWGHLVPVQEPRWRPAQADGPLKPGARVKGRGPGALRLGPASI